MVDAHDIKPLERAIKNVGSVRELARRVGVTPQAVWLWRKGSAIAAERAMEIDRATGGEVSKSDIRPDLWPREDAQ